MENIGAVSEHMKECPYNVKNDHTNAKIRNQAWDDVIKTIAKFHKMQGLRMANS